MINYTEKGGGLHDSIVAAGQWIMQRDGVWVSSDDVAVQSLIDGYTLDQCKNYKCDMIALHAKALRDKVMADISPAEMSSWPIKQAQAAKYAASSLASDAPMLSTEATARGVTLADLVAKVNAKSASFSDLEARISGADGKHRDAVKALTTFAAVVAYDFSGGWPAV